ncbi:putative phopshatase [Trypanosoma theileri]|uniref:Putative phopshatase n=1 Tax=Trypanosoma theileri TaxID=67003 RepID=A0A1X0NYU6_9TRYP|nr:putative phopshatase [Trypanosoma theileri]ORC89728.1 putative phopshatase [Trypanosoma theileri]
MIDSLKNIHWYPPLELVTCDESKSSEHLAPWLEFSEVFPGFFLTCEETVCNRVTAQEKGIALVLTLNGESHSAPFRVYEYADDVQRCVYRKLPSLDVFLSQLDEYTSVAIPEDFQKRKVFIRSVCAEDSPMYDISSHFVEMCVLIELVMFNRKKLSIDSTYLPALTVHCQMGVSRSTAIVLAYMMKRSQYSRDDALSMVKKVRAVANPNPGFQSQLSQWEKSGYYRVVDDVSAFLVANELNDPYRLKMFLEKYLSLIVRQNKLSSDREYSGIILSKANLSDDDLRFIISGFCSHITLSIADEVYFDVPTFFDNVCEMMTSFIHNVPTTLGYIIKENVESFEDAFYFEMFKTLSEAGFAIFPSDMASAFCSFLEAIDCKHFSRNESKRPRIIDSTGKVIGIAPEGMSLSFTFLPFLAPYAVGFIQQHRLESFVGKNLSTEQMEDILYKVLTTFRENFLLTSSGTGLYLDDTSTESRWHAGSRLRFLEFDMEVQIMESVEEGLTLSEAANRFMQLDKIDSHVILHWVRKLTGALIGVRFFCDAVDSYFNEHIAKLSLDTNNYSIANKIAPWKELLEIIEEVTAVYTKKYGSLPDLFVWIKKELEPLVSKGIVAFPQELY